jgi:hypothetical protein
MIFEDVNQRGVELKKRKERKIQHYQEQKYEREMKGVTFHPQLHSSKSLRNNCAKDFQNRLKDDHKNRLWQKMEILTE